jgi:hypothetical protein
MVENAKPALQESLDRIRRLFSKMCTRDRVLIHEEFCRRKDCNTCLKGKYGSEIKYEDDFWDF